MEVVSKFRKQIYLQAFVFMGIVFLLVFHYTPMFGIIMAFKDYRISAGISGIFQSDWVGFKYFVEFYNDYKFEKIVLNTLALSVLKLVFTFPIPIIFAIMLNEARVVIFRRVVQTASYLPHFISWIVVAGMSTVFLSSSGGIINELLMTLRLVDQPLPILTDPDYFYGLAVLSAMWKEAGWWTIIFLAAISGVDPSLYESAEMDGASRLRKIWHITLPGIKSSVIVVLILAIGNLLGGGLVGSNFEQAYLLGNTMNRDTSEIIQTYVFTVGLSEGRFAYAAAVDLIQAVLSVILIFGSNFVAKRITGTGLF